MSNWSDSFAEHPAWKHYVFAGFLQRLQPCTFTLGNRQFDDEYRSSREKMR